MSLAGHLNKKTLYTLTGNWLFPGADTPGYNIHRSYGTEKNEIVFGCFPVLTHRATKFIVPTELKNKSYMLLPGAYAPGYKIHRSYGTSKP